MAFNIPYDQNLGQLYQTLMGSVKPPMRMGSFRTLSASPLANPQDFTPGRLPMREGFHPHIRNTTKDTKAITPN